MGNATLQPASPRPEVRHQRLESVHRQRRHRATVGRPRRAAGGKPGAMPMRPHVCPWWGGYFIDNRLRRLFHKPEEILGPYVRSGMTVMDVGCGMGLFAIAMARLVGPDGRVIAVDLQQKMLDVLRKRAAKAGVGDRIDTHRCQANALEVAEPVDFALAFYSAHEVPDLPQAVGRDTRMSSSGRQVPRGRAGRPRVGGGFSKPARDGGRRRPRPGRSASHSPESSGGSGEGAAAPN